MVFTTLLDLSYTAFMLPLAFAFGFNHGHTDFTCFSLGIGLIFTLDLFIMLHR